MYHAAINILSNRADQLGLDEDELMHYGRKGMKWGKDIFGDLSAHARRDRYSKQSQADKRLKEAQREQEKQQKELEKKKDKLIKSAQKAHDKEKTGGWDNFVDSIFNKDAYNSDKIERYDPELAKTIAEGHEVYVNEKYDPEKARKTKNQTFDAMNTRNDRIREETENGVEYPQHMTEDERKMFDMKNYDSKPNAAINGKQEGYGAYNFLDEEQVKQERKERREAEKQARIEKKKQEKETQEAIEKSPEYQEQLRQDELKRKKEELLKRAREERYKRENGNRYIP